ncbi:MAG: hypothetical protein H7249_00300 [Chitinophagaceae bacterium]|nr:hypothetical protein [Oligoflexus sp.]
MNFQVQALIQDLENMGRFRDAVSQKEWQDKWYALKELSPPEYDAVKTACTENEGARALAWSMVQSQDPDPAKTGRSVAFAGFFSKD